jgi:parallel beta-helix repeat protein
MKITLIITLILLLSTCAAAEWNSTGNVLSMHMNNDSAYGENDSLVYDFSGNGNNGTITGPVYVVGKYGNALSFDGTDDYVSVSHDSSLTMSGDFTLEVWVKLNNPTDVSRFIYKYDGSTYYTLYYSFIEKRFYLSIYKGIQYDCYSNIYTSSDTNWHHVVGIRNGSNMSIYVDGNLQETIYSVPTDTLGSSGNLYLGSGYAGGTQFFKGSIDEVRIYNRALTAAEILEHATTPPPSECNSCDDCELKLNDVTYNDVRMTADVTNEPGTCINDPANMNDKIFNCQGYTVDGTDAANTYGIYLYTQTNNTIKNCVLSDWKEGIYLKEYSTDNTIKNNTITSCTDAGILTTTYSSGNTIQNNTLTGNVVGIGSATADNTINNNTACSNTNDFYSQNWLLSVGDNNTCDIPDGWNDDGTTGCTYICEAYDYQGTCEGYTATCDSSKTKYVLRFTDVEKCCVDYLQPLQDQVRSGSGTMEINGTCSVNNHGLTMTGHDCSGYPLWYILVMMVFGFPVVAYGWRKYQARK